MGWQLTTSAIPIIVIPTVKHIMLSIISICFFFFFLCVCQRYIIQLHVNTLKKTVTFFLNTTREQIRKHGKALGWMKGSERTGQRRRKGEQRGGQVWFPLSLLHRPLKRSRGGKVEKKERKKLRSTEGSSRIAPVCVQSESQINRPVKTWAIREQLCVLSL